jgi:hypothetical protein
MDIGSIYKWYLKVMALMGHTVRLPKARPQDRANNNSTSTLSATELDALATRAGNQYRALGTTVGLLGIAIVFLAIAPVGMQLEHGTEHILGWVKVCFMASMLLIVFVGSQGEYKNAWMSLRLKAEDARYLHRQMIADQ